MTPSNGNKENNHTRVSATQVWFFLFFLKRRCKNYIAIIIFAIIQNNILLKPPASGKSPINCFVTIQNNILLKLTFS